MRGRRARRREPEVDFETQVAALVRGHPGLAADVVARIAHHSRDVLVAIEPDLDGLDARALDLAATRLDAADPDVPRPERLVLFLSTRNDGMSIMAEAFVRAAGGTTRAVSAGVRPVAHVLRSVSDALAEVGAGAGAYPKPLTPELLASADLVVTMLCDAPPLHDGQRTEDWDFEDPAGLGPAGVRLLRDRIRVRVDELLAG